MLVDAGVLSGNDMTVEAALTKLSYVLGHQELAVEEKIKVRLIQLSKSISVEYPTNIWRLLGCGHRRLLLLLLLFFICLTALTLENVSVVISSRWKFDTYQLV